MKIPGIYQILFSNAASWFRGKDLAYRIVVLDPVSLEDEIVYQDDLMSKMPAFEEMYF